MRAPPDTYPLVKFNQDGRVEDSLADQRMPSFRDLFQARDVLKEELSRAIVHDSVLVVNKGLADPCTSWPAEEPGAPRCIEESLDVRYPRIEGRLLGPTHQAVTARR